MTFDLDLQKIGLADTEPVFMPKIRPIGPTVHVGEALKYEHTNKHIRKQYIWMDCVQSSMSINKKIVDQGGGGGLHQSWKESLSS